MKTRSIMAIGLLIFGSLIVGFAVVVEPSGELHASVLTFYGETIAAFLLLLGINPKNNKKQ